MMSDMPVPAGDALAGCLLGQALGDALGFVVEAESPEAAAAYVRSLSAARAGARGRDGFPLGQYSDDTQLARELLLAVRDASSWQPDVFARRIAALVTGGRIVGAGPGTRAAAERLTAGTPWSEAGTPAPYDGNGSAMRAAPIGVLFGGRPALMLRAAREQSLITHRDRRCAAGAMAVAGAASLAMSRTPIDPGEFLGGLASWVEAEDRGFAEAILALAEWVPLPPAVAALRLHESGLDAVFTGRWQGISASVVPSVVWSLYAFLRTPDDYWATICTAIRVGGDTDTMAAMAGAISGARLGLAALPEALLELVNDRGEWRAPELAALARECAGLARGWPDDAS
jgi:ADP-ribosylglycohydrolase